MIKLLVLLLVSSGVTDLCDPPECIFLPDPLEEGSTCENFSNKCLSVREGEAVYIVPDALKTYVGVYDKYHLFTWKRKKGNTSIYSSEERIHHHGPVLLFLPISINDSDHYIARFNMSGKCHIFCVPVKVVAATQRGPKGLTFNYLPIKSPETNPQILCPDNIKHLCEDEKGVHSWDRNSTLMAGEAGAVLQLQNVTKADSVLYTCRCTWKHMNKVYNSTAFRELMVEDRFSFEKIQIIHPTTKELMVHPGSPLSITCKALFGTNIGLKCLNACKVWWEKDNQSVVGMKGYKENSSWNMKESSTKSFISSTLIIDKVQESDFKASFRCLAKNHGDITNQTLTLKRAESLISLVVAMMCVSAVFLLAAAAIKYFAVDLVLFSRRFLPCTKARNDGLQYDVYVVYHSQKESKAMEEILSRFLYQALLQVLEQKCGFRVFIHGRDAIPGEDRLRQVEERVMLSRRLMVVLTPGSEVNEKLGSSPSGPPGEAVDWQIGLHHALLQEMRVILVQLGDMGPQGYTHLSPTLQHLVRKSAPLCWREDSPGAAHWNSRFWKRVRYAMPTAVAKPSSSVV